MTKRPKAKPARSRIVPTFSPADPATMTTEQQFKWQERLAVQSAAVRSAEWLDGAPPAAEPTSPRLRVLCIMPDLEASPKVRDAIYDVDTGDFVFAEQAQKRRLALAELRLHERLMAYLGEDSLCNEIVLDRVVDSYDVQGLDDTEVADKIVGFAQQTRPVDVLSYDLVFVEVDMAATKARGICAALPQSKLVIVHAKPPTAPSSVRRIPATVCALLRAAGDLVQERRAQIAMPWAAPLPTIPMPSEDDAYLDSLIQE